MTSTSLFVGVADDRGETTTQVVLVLPIVISILLIAVQASVYFHTSNVAGAAASRGASEATSDDESTGVVIGRAESAALELLDDSRTRLAAPVAVEVSTESVTVSVEVRVPRIAPFFPRTVRRTATEPRERFLTEAMR